MTQLAVEKASSRRLGRFAIPWPGSFGITRGWAGRIGLILALFALAIALLGPFFAPHGGGELVSTPYAAPTGQFPLGTDLLGRDVLSRILLGGRNLVILATFGTLVAYAIGAGLGLLAGFSRSAVDGALMRLTDVMFAFPPIILLLLVAFSFPRGTVTILVTVILVHVPSVIRVVRAATLDVAVRGYVEAAVARGDPIRRILAREILPNISGTVAADGGPRITSSIFLVAALGFFGLGAPPPAPDWASMINENRGGFLLQPWAVMVPTLLIGILTIGVNVVADTIARNLGTSIDEEMARR